MATQTNHFSCHDGHDHKDVQNHHSNRSWGVYGCEPHCNVEASWCIRPPVTNHFATKGESSRVLGSPGYVCKCIITRLLSSTSVLKLRLMTSYDCDGILLMVQKSCTTEKSPKLYHVFHNGFMCNRCFPHRISEPSTSVCHMGTLFIYVYMILYVYSLVHRDPGNSLLLNRL